MYRYTLEIDGMKCPMCEEHVSTLIKGHVDRAITVKADHRKNTCIVLSDIDLPDEAFFDAFRGSGYRIDGIGKETGLKDSFLFSFEKKHYKFYPSH